MPGQPPARGGRTSRAQHAAWREKKAMASLSNLSNLQYIDMILVAELFCETSTELSYEAS